jgi:hypothetical protein
MRDPRAVFTAMILLLFAPGGALAFRYPTQARPAGVYLGRWVARLAKRVDDAYREGSLTGARYDSLKARVARVKEMRSAALRDGLVTAQERGAIHDEIGRINMDVAEARFGPVKPKEEKWTRREPLPPRRAPGAAAGMSPGKGAAVAR